MKKVLLSGASGMIGSLVLKSALSSSEIDKVISIVRKPTGIKHEKLQEFVVTDFEQYTELETELQNVSIVYFCIGVYTGQVPDETFKKITVDYPVALAKKMKQENADSTFCLLSGAGADTSEKSRMSFARYKGMAENQLSAMGLADFYTFRPAYIYPVTPRIEPNLSYRIFRFLYPLLRLLGKNTSIESTVLAKVIFEVGLNGYHKNVLENRDLLDVFDGLQSE